jgi:hypothetical protein
MINHTPQQCRCSGAGCCGDRLSQYRQAGGTGVTACDCHCPHILVYFICHHTPGPQLLSSCLPKWLM